MNRSILLIVGVAMLSGCQTRKSLYNWGNYETVNYLTYAKPGKATLDYQREQLEDDLEDSSKLGAHPGLHAQLGYVYFQLGRVDDAVKQFAAEKTLFPESTIFMDRMIDKAKGSPAK